MNSLIRIGVLGCAKIAERSVIPAIRSLSSDFKLVAVASRNESKAKRFGEKFNCEPIVGYRNLIYRDDIDALYIPLPTGLHFEWVSKALEARKHVYVEKSFASSLAETNSLIQLAKENDVAVMEGYMFLYHRQQKFVSSLLQKDMIGEFRHFHSCFSFPPLPANNFRYDKDIGGGVLMDAAGYPLRATHLFCGNNMEVESASMYSDPRDGVTLWGSAFLSNKQGLGASIAFGFDNFYQCYYEILGSKGKLRADRAYTPGPKFSPRITVETSGASEVFEVEPDDHFVGAMLEFRKLVQQNVIRLDHYENIAKQSRALEEIKNYSSIVSSTMSNSKK